MSVPHDPFSPIDPAVITARTDTNTATAAPAAPVADPAPAVEEAHAPKGTSAEVLAWVGEDKERAQVALDTENAHKPRKGLVEELREILEK